MDRFSTHTLSSAEATNLWAGCEEGDPVALDRVLPLVYEELRRIARGYLRDERAGHTLQPTALVHEAYMRLTGQESPNWENRAQFLGMAAQMMRRILVNYGEARRAVKRQSSEKPVGIERAPFSDEQAVEALTINRALKELGKVDPRQEKIIELRFYAGFSIEETAEAMGVSVATVKRDWAIARLWIRKQLAEEVHQ